MKSKNENKIIWVVLACWVVITLLLVLNYKYSWVSLDYSFISVLVSNTVVIAIFVITYILIDKRSIRIQENKRKVAIVALCEVYDKCYSTISMMDNDWIRSNIATKINGQVPISEEKTIIQIHNYPFSNDGMILQFATDGILSKDEYEEYIKIKKDHWSFVYQAVAFYDYYMDHPGVKTSIEALKQDLASAKEMLKG